MVNNGLTLVHLANLMQNWGIYIHPNQYLMFEGYIRQMLKRNRVMVVWNGPFIEAVLFYFLTNEPDKMLKKPLWLVPDDEPEGKTVYIDKMICRKYTRTLRDNLGVAIQERFPTATQLVYHRAPKDRCVTIKREEKYEQVQNTVS